MTSNIRALRSMSIESVFRKSFERTLDKTYRGDVKLGMIAGLGLGLAAGLGCLAQGRPAFRFDVRGIRADAARKGSCFITELSCSRTVATSLARFYKS
jgi:hypothetical protein